MAKKASKKQTKKAEADMEKAFFDAVHPVLTGGYTEPMATQHARSAYRRFKENLE